MTGQPPPGWAHWFCPTLWMSHRDSEKWCEVPKVTELVGAGPMTEPGVAPVNGSPRDRGVSQGTVRQAGQDPRAVGADFLRPLSRFLRSCRTGSSPGERRDGQDSCSQGHLTSAPSGPLCIPSDVTQLCSLISWRKLCHSQEGGGTELRWGCPGMTQRQAASGAWRNVLQPSPTAPVEFEEVPKQGHFPVIRRWTPRPEMPRLEMKKHPTE